MQKNIQKSQNLQKNMSKNTLHIAITGVESTGKSTLAKALSQHFNTIFLPEIARDYLQKKPKTYQYTADEVLKIGLLQLKSQEIFIKEHTEKNETQTTQENKKILFFDTEISVIKVWYETKYQQKIPAFFSKQLHTQDIDVYLLPYPDIAWTPDPLRETMDLDTRLTLFDTYIHLLTSLQKKVVVIKGEGQNRIQNAINAVNGFLEGIME